MEAQSLSQAPGLSQGPGFSADDPTDRDGLRRLLVIGGAVLLTAAAAREMYLVLNGAGPNVLGIVVLVLFVALFAWIALAFTSALAGFASMLLAWRAWPRHRAAGSAAAARQPHRFVDADL